MMAADERALLAETLGQLAREHDGAELTKALKHFGFAELLAASPRVAVAELFTAMGRVGSTSAAIQDVLGQPLADLADLADHGAARPAVLLPAVGQAVAGTLHDGTLTLRGLLLGQREADVMLAPLRSGGEIVWVLVPDQGPSARRLVAGLDPALALTEVTLTMTLGAAGGPAAKVLLAGEEAARRWQAVAAAGRRALGYQIVGAVSQMIELAVRHASERVQFGRPVGSFQAVRHRLADSFVAREGAIAALDLAWDSGDERLAGMLAKSLAGRAARIAATQCQQVLAGIGFTAEHPFHRYLFRTMVLDRVLGSAAELPAEIGRELAAAGAVPRLAEL
jgi:alkylation response protein AidB-like acyl-CoA dehydrogenase